MLLGGACRRRARVDVIDSVAELTVTMTSGFGGNLVTSEALCDVVGPNGPGGFTSMAD